jgi:hypothetical protein
VLPDEKCTPLLRKVQQRLERIPHETGLHLFFNERASSGEIVFSPGT